MSDQCPKCRECDTQPGLDRSHCLACGTFFHVLDGETVATSADAAVSDWSVPGPLDTDLGTPTASQPGTTEGSLQQDGAEPQSGLLGDGVA